MASAPGSSAAAASSSPASDSSPSGSSTLPSQTSSPSPSPTPSPNTSTSSSNPSSPSSTPDPSVPTSPSPTPSSPPPSPPPSSPPPSQPPSSPPSSPPPSTPPTTPPPDTSSPSSTPSVSPPISPSPSNGGGNGQSTPGGSSSSSPPPSDQSSSGTAGSLTSSALPSSITSTSASTFITTNAAGDTITSTVEKTIVITPSRLPGSSGSTNDTAHSSSHAGAIAGGVVGGIAGLLILAILGWWLTKRWRKQREMEEFDGDFDPDRVTGGRVANAGAGNLDLAAGEGRVVPYSYSPAGGANPQMSQTAGSVIGGGAAGLGAGAIGTGKAGPPPSSFNYNNQRPGPPTAPSAYSQPSAYSTSDHDGAVAYGQSQQGHGRNPSQTSAQQHSAYGGYSDAGGSNVDGSEGAMSSPRSSAFPGALASGAYVPNVNEWRQPSPGPSLPATNTSGTLPSSKELEARGLRVTNQQGGSPFGESSGPVVQHQDGGRVVQGEEVPEVPAEIPPSYDSIRRD